MTGVGGCMGAIAGAIWRPRLRPVLTTHRAAVTTGGDILSTRQVLPAPSCMDPWCLGTGPRTTCREHRGPSPAGKFDGARCPQPRCDEAGDGPGEHRAYFRRFTLTDCCACGLSIGHLENRGTLWIISHRRDKPMLRAFQRILPVGQSTCSSPRDGGPSTLLRKWD